MNPSPARSAYALARERYAALGVDAERALRRLERIPISIHCWQGDDVTGFEAPRGDLGGVLPTGNYPGRARTADELRADLDQALALIPGRHRVNLHAIYAEPRGRPADRDTLEPAHFSNWIDWARARRLGLDFNGSFFSHPKAGPAGTLSHPDPAIRRFWIAHAQACRRIGAAMGRRLQTPCIVNIWVPDGSKDTPADRRAPRQRLAESLDAILQTPLNPVYACDTLEGKLFGLGSESYVVGSHDFYLAYAVARRTWLTLDTGHFHPTESVADKLSAILPRLPGVFLHVSRGVRWDSDHVVTLTDDLRALAEELVRGNYLARTVIGLDYFDASINRVAAWVIGARAMGKALLAALLEPSAILQRLERAGDLSARLALLETCKTLPLGAVWDEFCRRRDVPPDTAWLDEVNTYERAVLCRRS